MRLVELTLTWVAVCLVVPTPSAADQLLFDNGSFSGPQILRIIGPHIIFDDFALPVGSTITGIEWSQHDLPGLPLASVEITFYDGVPSSETLIHAFTVVATTTPNDTGTIYDLEGFDYAVSGLSLHLNAGTYWMGLRSVVSTFGQTWDQTIGNESTIPGRYQAVDGVFPATFYPEEDSVFRLIGLLGPFGDADTDGIPDSIDNCPADANPDQADADLDFVGDACDPFPNDPNNEQAQCEADLAQATKDLAECQALPVFRDADDDGEEDSTDDCPGTPLAVAVDGNGCSLAQFCMAIDTSTTTGQRVCRSSDWGNDEPITNPEDCTLQKQGRRWRAQSLYCVPASP